MELIEKIITYKNKKFPVRISNGLNPEYIIITHHGILSNNTSFRYFEKWIGERAKIISYDARVNGKNTMRASRLTNTYVRDLRDIVRWAKLKYPKIKIVTLGSSWGATIVASYTKKYDETFKNIAWSIPYNFIANQEDKQIKNDNQNYQEVKQTTKWGYVWRFFLMLVLNINMKAYAKLDYNRIANNKALLRTNKIIKPQPTSVKLFWSAGKAIKFANHNLKIINKKNALSRIFYIQSTNDTYLLAKKLDELKKNNGRGVTLSILNEGKHAFHWEKENGFNERIFQMVWDYLKII